MGKVVLLEYKYFISVKILPIKYDYGLCLASNSGSEAEREKRIFEETPEADENALEVELKRETPLRLRTLRKPYW